MTNRTTRENEQRATEYSPPGELTLPEGLEKYYNDNGFHVRWIRAELNGQDDSRNVAMRMREGYRFIQKSEVPEQWRDFFDTRKVRNNNQVVCVGDLILGKIEKDRAEARQKYYEDQSTAQVTHERNVARDGGSGKADTKLDKFVPLEDLSKTEVKTGKGAQD